MRCLTGSAAKGNFTLTSPLYTTTNLQSRCSHWANRVMYHRILILRFLVYDYVSYLAPCLSERSGTIAGAVSLGSAFAGALGTVNSVSCLTGTEDGSVRSRTH